MGALAAPKWIPEDDLLLKNAVEAGASLESLAKGAVRFSRRFTIKELTDHWRALLYDVNTSTEAAAKIIELEIEFSASNPSKGNRPCSIKGKDTVFEKRKLDTVRSQYYAMRKRVRSDPHTPDLTYNAKPFLHVDHHDICGHLEYQTKFPYSNCVPAESLLSHYGRPHVSCNSEQKFPLDRPRGKSLDANGDFSSHSFLAGHVVGELPNEIVSQDCLYEYTNNRSMGEIGTNNTDQPFEHDFVQGEVSQILREDILSLKSCSELHDTASPHAFPGDAYDKADGEGKPSSNFDTPSDDNLENLRSAFVPNQGLTPQVSCCDTSTHQFSYSSTPSHLPVWGDIDHISNPAMSMVPHFEDKNQNISSSGMLIDEVKTFNSTESEEPKVADGMPDARIDQSTFDSEGSLMELSDNLLDFAADLLEMNMAEEVTGDRSCLNSILLNSPADKHDGVHKSSDSIAPDGGSFLQSDIQNSQEHTQDKSAHGVSCSGEMPSTSLDVSHNVGTSDGLMICTLNTEDPEIPCNDEFLPLLSSTFPGNVESLYTNEICSSSSYQFVDGKAAREGSLVLRQDLPVSTRSHHLSANAGSATLQSSSLLHSTNQCRVTAESVQKDSQNGDSRRAHIVMNNTKSCSPTHVASIGVGAHGDKRNNVLLDSSVETPGQRTDKPLIKNSNSCKQEPDFLLPTTEGAFTGAITTLSMSDHEEPLPESEDDIPSFSDVEAVILDMDLGPHDEESCLLTKEAARYQCMDTKKAIIRLEQGAQAFLQRSMSARGAVAILYGRRLKYFMRNSKILLGRATEDLDVDVDLSLEGRANKVSRRQAIIRMDDDGLFCLKNIGSKCAIYVNSKEVLPRKRITLISGCLIEIRNMRFIFEVNNKAVQQYITNLRGISQELNPEFKCIPDQNL